MTFESLLTIIRLVALSPYEAARRIIALNLPRPALWVAFWLVTVMTAIILSVHAGFLLAGLELGTAPPVVIEALTTARDSPALIVVTQAAFLFLTTHALHRVGRGFGGTGDFAGALHVVVALQACLALLTGVQLLALLILPPLGALFGFAFLVFLFWHIPSFIMGLHGFQNRLAVLAMMVVTFVGVEIVLAVLSTIVRLAIT